MLKEKFTKVKQKTGAVIKKTCKYVYENRGIIGYYAGMIITAIAYEYCFNPQKEKGLKEVSFNKGYEVGHEHGCRDTINVFNAFHNNGLLVRTMDGEEVNFNDKAKADEYSNRVNKIQQDMLGHNVVNVHREDE